MYSSCIELSCSGFKRDKPSIISFGKKGRKDRHSCDVMNKENPGLDCIIIYGNTHYEKGEIPYM